MQNLIDSRRFKFVPVTEQEIWSIIALNSKGGNYFRIILDGLPEDAIFNAAIHDIHTMGVNCVVYHESFPSVPVGQRGEILSKRYYAQEYEPVEGNLPPYPGSHAEVSRHNQPSPGSIGPDRRTR